jgi:hypothetical protein
MLLEACKQVEGLKAVDPEFLEEIVLGTEPLAGDLKMLGGEPKNLLRRILQRAHKFYLAITGALFDAQRPNVRAAVLLRCG